MKSMNRALTLTLAAALLVGCRDKDESTDRIAAGRADTAAAAQMGEGGEGILVDGFSGPEAVLHDPAADVYLVSNMNGAPGAVDGNGFISRLSPSGEILALRWIDGATGSVTLNAPKGMALRGDTLFVADIDTVRLFNRKTGDPIGSWPVEGAVFVNDVAVGADGRLYVSDSGVRLGGEAPEHTGAAAIHVFKPDGSQRILEAGDVTGINGIAMLGNRLYGVTGFGRGNIFTLEGGERVELPELPGLRLDGIVVYGDSALLISDWDTEAVYLLRSNGSITTVARNVESPADIGLDAGRGRLLIPGPATGRVLLTPLASAPAATAGSESAPGQTR